MKPITEADIRAMSDYQLARAFWAYRRHAVIVEAIAVEADRRKAERFHAPDEECYDLRSDFGAY